MKSRISFLMFLSFLFFWSCQKDEVTLPEEVQTDNAVNLRSGPAVIYVHWGEDYTDPVQGARVFDMESNELISETNDEGSAYIDPVPGVYRVVDPNYGAQQAIVKYPEDFEYDEIYKKGRKVIAWDMNGNPIYGKSIKSNGALKE